LNHPFSNMKHFLSFSLMGSSFLSGWKQYFLELSSTLKHRRQAMPQSSCIVHVNWK
jgi:hypothetical protein